MIMVMLGGTEANYDAHAKPLYLNLYVAARQHCFTYYSAIHIRNERRVTVAF